MRLSLRLTSAPLWALIVVALVLAALMSLRVNTMELRPATFSAPPWAPVEIQDRTAKPTAPHVIVPPVQAPPTQAPQAPVQQKCLFYPNTPTKAHIRGGCPVG